MNQLELIKNSFEKWYNSKLPKEERKSIVINYSDEQTLLIKAYHKVTITMMAVGIEKGLSYTAVLIQVTENYNHGTTTEEEAKDHLTKKFLTEVFSYCQSN